MKKLLFACATVGLAAGAGYLLYRAWKSYYGEREDSERKENSESNEAVRKRTIFKLLMLICG